ncbi:uncharacterized protein LOC120616670 [Pteropus medius]|uniref:uncharacterized protein LOC120616670 n=1 Tax=Pteropus vampyrus TaxID=132908 RepID=UPI00196B15EF|nr:uncharacterized protein LOC120616670 [Pteropus giganteus]
MVPLGLPCTSTKNRAAGGGSGGGSGQGGGGTGVRGLPGGWLHLTPSPPRQSSVVQPASFPLVRPWAPVLGLCGFLAALRSRQELRFPAAGGRTHFALGVRFVGRKWSGRPAAVSANCSWLRTPGACAAPSGSASPPGLGASASLHARGRWAPPLLSLCPRACHVRSSDGAESSLDKHPPPVPRRRVPSLCGIAMRVCLVPTFRPRDRGAPRLRTGDQLLGLPNSGCLDHSPVKKDGRTGHLQGLSQKICRTQCGPRAGMESGHRRAFLLCGKQEQRRKAHSLGSGEKAGLSVPIQLHPPSWVWARVNVPSTRSRTWDGSSDRPSP